MVRVPAPLALMLAPLLAISLSLSACGSPEATPGDTPAVQGAEAPATSAEQTPMMPDDAPPQEEDDGDQACSAAIGTQAATRLAQRCTLVSPATHPPCNVQNPCEMIQGEIDRACAQYGPDETKPAECAA